ncbi:hypothetical protein RhiTH_010325 [Rhizoctonia solani]
MHQREPRETDWMHFLRILGLSKPKSKGHVKLFGPNKLEFKKQNPFLQSAPRYLPSNPDPPDCNKEVPKTRALWSAPEFSRPPQSCAVAIALSNNGGCTSNWPDFVGIVLLLLINLVIGFYKERGAANANKALMDLLASKAKVRHNGKWSGIEFTNFVPGDTFAFKIDFVPTYYCLARVIDAQINQTTHKQFFSCLKRRPVSSAFCEYTLN